MAVLDRSGGAGRHPDKSPERGRGRRRRRQSCASEKVKVGDGAAAGGAWILRALQGARGQCLLTGYLMTLVKEKEKIITAHVL